MEAWSIGSYIRRTETNEKILWSHYFISNQTSLPQQKWQIHYSLIERYFAKPAQYTACTLIILALQTAARNKKKFLQRKKKQPLLCGKTAQLAALPGCLKNAMVWLNWLFVFWLFNLGCSWTTCSHAWADKQNSFVRVKKYIRYQCCHFSRFAARPSRFFSLLAGNFSI